MKMFHKQGQGKNFEKIHAQTVLYLIDRFVKNNQLEPAAFLLEISREFFPGDPRFAGMAGEVFTKLDEQVKEKSISEAVTPTDSAKAVNPIRSKL